MTARQESRREQARRLRRLIREHEEREARRERAHFEGAVESLLDRVRSGTPRPAPERTTPVAVSADPASFEAAMAALLARVEDRPPPPPPPPEPPPRSREDVFWSPHPLLGYRIWELKDGRLHGAWTPWETHRKTAVCLDKNSKAKGPSPHDAAACPHPPCGIYALKEPRKAEAVVLRTLRQSTPTTLAIGLVAMTGRVIEHAQGYRAQHAEVIALAMVTGGQGKNTVLTTIERALVPAAFAQPRSARSGWSPIRCAPADAMRQAVEFLRERELVAAT